MTTRETMILISPKGARIGNCSYTSDRGWRFLSAIASHGNSRKFWPSAEACIPRWAHQYGGTLLTATERQIGEEAA